MQKYIGLDFILFILFYNNHFIYQQKVIRVINYLAVGLAIDLVTDPRIVFKNNMTLNPEF